MISSSCFHPQIGKNHFGDIFLKDQDIRNSKKLKKLTVNMLCSKKKLKARLKPDVL
jgi:hypothetical protein